jgi:hypothetical protein
MLRTKRQSKGIAISKEGQRPVEISEFFGQSEKVLAMLDLP